LKNSKNNIRFGWNSSFLVPSNFNRSPLFFYQVEEKRAQDVQAEVAKQEKELEKMRKKRLGCVIL
jgi:hypothetical protein